MAPPQHAHRGGPLKLIIIALVALLLLIAAGGGAYYFLVLKAAPKAAMVSNTRMAANPHAPPVFFALDPFTVNLQSDDGERYLHLGLTLKLTDPNAEDALKEHMPEIRSRILLLLSNKHPADVATPEGKAALIKELQTQIELPFSPG